MAAMSGKIIGISNTDLVPGCYSYGQWIMIKHPNGLSTLYAHLSVESVAVGDTVATGQIIGYSGNTGYTTGPHLHFGVYASDGVQIKKFDTSINCKGATIPVADFKAYLNPLSYLPPQ
jgi:murein DD-endopeptidase MepM/ murein hydrolase activator NlpD